MEKNKKVPKRGEIWLVKFRKSKETPKTFRPCFVFSSDIQNELNDLIAVAPISTENIEIIEPFEVFIQNTPETGLDYPSKIQFIYPMTIDKELRLVDGKRLGVVSKEVMEKAKLAWKVAFNVEE
jgi:mRNA-degrading endonuclease toxin of MazEF toxin-antitoxin module